MQKIDKSKGLRTPLGQKAQMNFESRIGVLVEHLYETHESCYFITVNPYDHAMVSQTKSWCDMVYRNQYLNLKKTFLTEVRKDYLEGVFTVELSGKGRLHLHGIVVFSHPQDRFFFTEKLRQKYADTRHPAVSVDIYPLTESFIEKKSVRQSTTGLNYLLKDVAYMKSKGYDVITAVIS